MMTGKRRSFQRDAQKWARSLAVDIHGIENLPQTGPAVVVMNHYHRPGFQALWFALALAAAAPVEMHWTMTAAWTDDGTPGARWRALFSPHLLPRLANVYGFTSMPPMPPQPHEAAARAQAVRSLLSLGRQNPPPVLALAPEGRDSAQGTLLSPPPGVGRMFAILHEMGFVYHPVGIYETDRLVIACGKPFRLTGIHRDLRADGAANIVMRHIAALVPGHLRGDYVT